MWKDKTKTKSVDILARSWSSGPADLEKKILDVTGPIQQMANHLRRQEPIDWLPYLEAGLLSQRDYAFVSALQNAKSKEDRDGLLDYVQDGSFNDLVRSVQRACVIEEVQTFLVLIDDMLWEDGSRVKRFNPDETKPWKGFLEMLTSADDFVRNISSRIISKLISQAHQPDAQDLKFYFNWLKDQLRPDSKYLLSVARCLQTLLRVDPYRVLFMDINGIFRIIRLLSSGIKPQAQYQLVFCLWAASFNPLVADKLNKYGIIPVLMDLLECSPSEIVKLPRMIIATFRNLLENPREEAVRKHNALIMIQCKLGKYLNVVIDRQKNVADPELMDDVQALDVILKKNIADLSTFDEYQLEVKSGLLEWSVVHSSKPFWTGNADRLNDNKYELLKILLSLLETSQDNTVLCVAAHDLGQYMSHYPRGKRVVEELGGKDVLLRLLSHQHPSVKYHALKSLQILMLSSYDVLIDYVGEDKAKEMEKRWNKDECFGL